MALTASRIVNAATSTLREQGLAGLSMRRLAQGLGVQPGALYHHVASKQELLVAVGEQLLSDSAPAICTTDPAQAAADLRTALLPIRDGAEVISFVHAYKPNALGPLNDLHVALARRLPRAQAPLVAEALIRYVLGFVAVEQNHAELVRARIVEPGPATPDAEQAFSFGVRALLAGIEPLRAGS
ncbi:MAG: TetR family transcriptional regulator, partial [Solirubrobacteraceae bacterium]